VGLIGGGTKIAPGEISLAHRGVLFLDELPEFPRSVLEALRQPLEDGVITISRAQGSLSLPAVFLLLAASNPCPCGFLGHPKKTCRCSLSQVARYKKRVSGPLLDRIDIHIDVPPVEEEKLTGELSLEKSKIIRERVEIARERQRKRFRNEEIKTNGEMSSSQVRKICQLSDEAHNLLKQAVSRLSISARSYFKVIKIAQTIADLSGKEEIEASFIAEALQYRVKEE
jgi:magnesium chelatase family protein